MNVSNDIRREVGHRRTCPRCAEQGLTPERGHVAALKTNADGSEYCFRCGVEFRPGDYRVPKFHPRVVPTATTGEVELERLDIHPLPSEPVTRIQAEMVSYLNRRHISSGTVRAWGLYYAVAGRYANRVVFPCYRISGIEFFVARSIIHGVEPKTLYPYKGGVWAGKSEVVWGLDRVQAAEDITVCEGVFDAAVVPNGVALLGKSVSAKQVMAIGLRAARVNVMLDGDDAGVEASKEVARRFRTAFPRLRITVVRVPRDEDPSSMGPESALSCILSQVG
jgi:hypothetical protein